MSIKLLVLLSAFLELQSFHCFQVGLYKRRGVVPRKVDLSLHDCTSSSRRSLLWEGFAFGSLLVATGGPSASQAAIGELFELNDANSILQGLTVRVADKSQQDAMVTFLSQGFGMNILRQRISGGGSGVEEIWMGFGPEQLSIPKDFVFPVSSFNMYGGHASIKISYDPSQTSVFYRTGNEAPGDNIAYLQLAVPEYRISQMVKNGGNILDAYGFVNVVSPSGLPIRGIVGIAPDPIMFVAVNCRNVEESKSFYKQQLGFTEQEYPYARPSRGLGQFEPFQPPKSVYLAPSKNSMGVLLLPSKKKTLTVNPVVESLNIVYDPSYRISEAVAADEPILDPSGVSLSFQTVESFEEEERITR